MKRIGVFLGCHPYGGGTFQYSQTILDALYELKQEKKIDVCVAHENFDWEKYLTEYDFESFRAPQYFVYKVILKIWKTFRFPLYPLRIIFNNFHPLIKELKKKDCDIWIFPSQDQWPIFILDFKTIATVHDLMHRYESRFPEVGNKKEFKNREFLYSNICKYANKILTDSEFGKNQLMESYGIQWKEKIFSLPYTIPKALTQITPDLLVLKRREIDDSFFIVYPAQFWMHKNHISLLKAFKDVIIQFPKLKLILAGSEKNGSNEVMKYISDNNLTSNVHILGYITDHELAGLYKLSKALVMPTFFGPTNIPPLEAQFFGCPVVYSKIYGYQEMPIENVILINPRDENSIRDGIIKALTTYDQKNHFSYAKSFETFKKKLKNIIEENYESIK